METEGLSILKIMWSAGITVKLVLLLLVVCSVWSWAVILKKRKFYLELKLADEEFLKIYQGSENFEEVIAHVEDVEFSSYKEVFIQGYDELSRLKDRISEKNANSISDILKGPNLARSLEVGVNNVNIDLDGKLSSLATIGSITPFVGLFGTVWGIIDSFTGLASGGATLDAVAPGIAEALVATAIGLLAAIPAVWFYNYYSNLNEKINVQMDSFSKDVLNYIDRIFLNR